MRTLEDKLRIEVGPQFGFDLNHIKLHYEHRRRLRGRYPCLQYGHLVLLKAHHRFGQHDHIFAFARVYNGTIRHLSMWLLSSKWPCRAGVVSRVTCDDDAPGDSPSLSFCADEIAVVAANFSQFSATFSIDNSPLAEAFGANDNPSQPSNRCATTSLLPGVFLFVFFLP